MGQGVNLAKLADVGGFLQRVLTDRAHVHVFDGGMGELLRVVERGQAIEAVVWNLGDADMGLSRIGLGGEMGLSENLKQRSLAYLRQSNDSSFHKGSWLFAVVCCFAE